MKDILERDRSGEPVSCDDPEYYKIKAVIDKAKMLTQQLNTQVLEEEEIRRLFSELTGQKVEDDFTLWTPFYTDFGANIRVGKNVFINHACTFMDRGGITLDDDVFIGPKVCLITENHGLEPSLRRTLTSKPIHIERGVWIGAGDVVVIPANVKHWHGAKRNSWFSHIAVEVPGENTSNEWQEPVTDEEYNLL